MLLALGAFALVGVGLWAKGGKDPVVPPAKEAAATGDTEHQPQSVALLTSLPILFAEQFGLAGSKSPVQAALEPDYRLEAVSVADKASLAPHRLLFMAHPRAQPAEALVELDAWVRSGGRLLLLADPRLDWPSDRPMGDRLRPPPDFADTGLLAHWGVQLEGPVAEGPVVEKIGDLSLVAISPGRLAMSGPDCRTDGDGFVARCAIGKGKVTVIADADFVNVAALDSEAGQNLALVRSELDRLAR